MFTEVEEDLHLPEGAKQRLNKSYRSSQTVLDAVNAVFSRLAASPAFAGDVRLMAVAENWQAELRAAHHRQKAGLAGYVELGGRRRRRRIRDEAGDGMARAKAGATMRKESAMGRRRTWRLRRGGWRRW